MQEMQVRSLSWEDLLEKEMASRSSVLAWEIPWTEKSGGLQSVHGSQSIRHDWAHRQTRSTVCLAWKQASPWASPHLPCVGLALLEEVLAPGQQGDWNPHQLCTHGGISPRTLPNLSLFLLKRYFLSWQRFNSSISCLYFEKKKKKGIKKHQKDYEKLPCATIQEQCDFYLIPSSQRGFILWRHKLYFWLPWWLRQ